MAAELADRLAIYLLAVRRFPSMGAADSRSLCYDSYVSMQHFVRRTTYVPFRRLGEMCGESPCNVLLVLFMAPWAPISALLCMRAVLMLWHAFLFLGLKFLPLFFFLLNGHGQGKWEGKQKGGCSCLVASAAFSSKKCS
jgi:hypothetical protein